MTTAPSHPLNVSSTGLGHVFAWLLPLVCLVSGVAGGCSKPAPIEEYTIPTSVPEQLRPGKERMLAAMVRKGDAVWFFKVSGPEGAVDEMDSQFRSFVERIEFRDDVPDLASLPERWRQAANKNDRFRFASIDVNTPMKQLDVSVSRLSLQDDWDAQVKMNVNRWRGQLDLPASEEKWAGGEPLEVAAADPTQGVWVDLLGDPSASGSMSPPFANSMPRSAGPSQSQDAGKPASSTESSTPVADVQDERLKFDRPDGWRDGRRSTMRLASFNVGPEDATAELTVIPAGGDLRGNVARWLGQVWKGKVPDEVVDQALRDATQLKVDGRPAQRFFLTGEDATSGEAIDATIIPLQDGVSLFVKMTGPAETVSSQSDAIGAFLDSLQLNL
jgi:hypothetical protein